MFKASTGNSSQHELLSRCFCDHVSPNVNKLWLLLLCYLRVRFQLASPPGFHFNTSRRGTLNTCINVFFSPFGTFFSSGRGSFLVLSDPWHTGSPPELNTQVLAPAEVRGTCSGGSKWLVRSGRHSEHVEPSTPIQTHVHNTLLTGWKMSDVSCDIWVLEFHQCRQTLHTRWWTSFSPTPQPCQTFNHLNYTRVLN